ncbi:MAG: hypothetical protein ACJAZO_002956 [Myxococcota bacterium]|jgi:hypothetical protein
MASDVLDRVRKLLALATSPNVHEAAAAAVRAQRLIDEHRLQDLLAAEAAEPDFDDARDEPIETSKRLRPWKASLASVLAEASGCVAYTLTRGRKQSIVLVGRSEDREAVAAMYSALVAQVEWLSATAGPGQTKKWHASFRLGAVHSIRTALSERPEPTANNQPGALVHAALTAQRDAVRQFVSDHLRLRPGKRLTVLGSAWEQGREASIGLAKTLKR